MRRSLSLVFVFVLAGCGQQHDEVSTTKSTSSRVVDHTNGGRNRTVYLRIKKADGSYAYSVGVVGPNGDLTLEKSIGDQAATKSGL